MVSAATVGLGMTAAALTVDVAANRDYPIWYSWQMGRDVNNASARPSWLSAFQYARAVAFYPSVKNASQQLSIGPACAWPTTFVS